MPKKNYKSAVLDYLLNHVNEDITRDALISVTGISTSRLSEILTSIKRDGYNVITPPRSGLVRLETNHNQVVLPDIKDADLRQWLILFLLSHYGPLSYRDLVEKLLSMKEHNLDTASLIQLQNKKVYDDASLIASIRENYVDDILVAEDLISITCLRKDIASLRKQGLIELVEGKHVTYQLTATAPYILTLSEDSLYQFCLQHEGHASSTTSLAPVKHTVDKIRTLIGYDESTQDQHQFGKQNQINQEQIDSFNTFIAYPYKTNQLEIHSVVNQIEHSSIFSVALLFYSVETSAFYAFGMDHTTGKKAAYRLDFIHSISATDRKNMIFHADDYYEEYEEMFSTSYTPEKYHVKVLYDDYGNVNQRFQSLHKTRRDSTIRLIENKPEGCNYSYVYEDDLRGLTDFARFLRSFGYSVMAVKPAELTDTMKRTYNLILENYEKLEAEENE